MGGYVNGDSGGWTELRVHGVSGTSAENLLDHPHPQRVDGDDEAGFYRRRWESEVTSADTPRERLEAYCWGGLTAGSGQRALWLLLTPFMLVNVAFWAVPYASRTDRGLPRAVRRTSEAIQRLFALSITLSLVTAFVAVSMNFVGWQCAEPFDTCAAKYTWLRFLSWSWIDLPGRRLAVTAVAPLAAIGLLWWLANKSWSQTEKTDMLEATESDQETPLERRNIWNGERPVRRLRAVHITAGFALVAVFLLAPFRALGGWPGGLFVVALVVLGGTVVLACLPPMTDRKLPSEETEPRVDLYGSLPWAALALVLGAGVAVWLQAAGADDLGLGDARTPLPWFVDVARGLAVAQIVSWLAMLALLPVLRRFAATSPEPQALGAEGATVVQTPLAWRGLATSGLMLLGAALATAFAAGMALAVAHLLGRPAPSPLADDAFILPMTYFWTAALSTYAAVLAVALAVAAFVRLRLGRAAARNAVDRAYPAVGLAAARAARADATLAVTRDRGRHIAVEWSNARMAEVGRWALGWFVTGLAVGVAVAVAFYLYNADVVYTDARWAVNVGDLLVGGFALFLLYVGRQAYNNPKLRRTVGVLWDVGTFWPRATHPLAPPSYAERAVPDLVSRVNKLVIRGGGHVLLSCHSQGAVIGTAVVMQLSYPESAGVGLLTYGSPVRRLYARFFPAYFGVNALRRAGAFLVGEPVLVTDEARRSWPWRNLYRPSDPIGGPVLIEYGATEISPAELARDVRFGDNDDIDRQLVDPRFASDDGEREPPTRGHSSYPDDPAYRTSATIVRELRMKPRPPGPGEPPDDLAVVRSEKSPLSG